MHSRQVPSKGDVVRVRNRRHLIEEDPLPDDHAEGCTVVKLRCIEDDALVESLDVLWEKQLDAQLITNEARSKVASQGFDQGFWFQAYDNTVRWGFVTSTDAELFQSHYRESIQVQAYQIEPLRRATQMSHVNLFIADDVGLGKTIEAGLVLREMMIPQKVQHCVICPPPSVVHQWPEDMEQRGAQKAIDLHKRLEALKSELRKAKKDLTSKLSKTSEGDVEQLMLGEALEAWQSQRIHHVYATTGQLKLDLEHIEARLRELTPKKIAHQQSTVRESFEVTLTRFEPVGLLYLWPHKSCEGTIT